MRPRSIVLFERVYWLHILFAALWLGWFYLSSGHFGAGMRPDTPAGSRQLLAVVSGGISVVSIGIALLLCFFIARRGSSVAKWIFLAFFVLALLSVTATAFTFARGATSAIGLAAAGFSMALRLLCLWLLFRPDATAWFRGRHSPVELFETFS